MVSLLNLASSTIWTLRMFLTEDEIKKSALERPPESSNKVKFTRMVKRYSTYTEKKFMEKPADIVRWALPKMMSISPPNLKINPLPDSFP